MLTDAEKKWLRERRHENCETCKTHHLLCDRCSHIYPGRVWAWNRFTLSGLNVETTYDELRDVAEFEARVAESIARDAHNCALDEMMFQHQEGDKPQGWYILRDARLAVEDEMEKEKNNEKQSA